MKYIITLILLTIGVQVTPDNFYSIFEKNKKSENLSIIGDKNAFNYDSTDTTDSQVVVASYVREVENLEIIDPNTLVYPQKNENSENNSQEEILSEKHYKELDFAAQAPFGNWELPFKEACEEASVIMAAYYFENKSLTPQIMEEEILKTVTWQEENFGYYKDTNMLETEVMMENLYGFNSYILENPTQSQMQQILAQGNLIIAPFAGQQLGNPHYVPPGPPYHVLLIHGYNEDSFITHDPGTRHGANFEYSYETIMNALHDFNGGNILEGVARIIVITPEKI